MADALELHVTMPDKERATSLARVLVDEGLAACVNIVPGVRSIYQWDGKVQEDDEVLCLIKTRPAIFERARAASWPCTPTRSRRSWPSPSTTAAPRTSNGCGRRRSPPP